MKKKAFVLLLSFALLGATGCHYNPERVASFVLNRISGFLDLDADQRELLYAVHREIKASREDTKQERRGLLLEWRAQVLSDEIKPETAEKLIHRQRRMVEDEIIPRVLAKLVELHRSLRPEQKQTLAKALSLAAQ